MNSLLLNWNKNLNVKSYNGFIYKELTSGYLPGKIQMYFIRFWYHTVLDSLIYDILFHKTHLISSCVFWCSFLMVENYYFRKYIFYCGQLFMPLACTDCGWWLCDYNSELIYYIAGQFVCEWR